MAEDTTTKPGSLIEVSAAEGKQNISATPEQQGSDKTNNANKEVSTAQGGKPATYSADRLRSLFELFADSDSDAGSPAHSASEARSRTYESWSTQPVPRISNHIEAGVNEPIEADEPIDTISAECCALPDGLRWETVKLSDQAQLDELYSLLTENYVEDDDCMFRFDYGRDFLRWALQPPGWHEDWHCGVRENKSGRLVGFISTVPSTTRIYDTEKRMVDINFLCVHKELRSKRLTPILTREMTRRVKRTGIFQAVYTAGANLPKPVGYCRYWHRSLNPKKLVECRFTHLARTWTMQRTIELYKLPDAPKLEGLRPITKKEIHSAWQLVSQYLKRFDLAPVFNEEEFEHWMIPRDNVVDSFVTTDSKGEVTDFVSFFTLPTSVINNPQHKSIKAAYLFYYASRAHMNGLQAAKTLAESNATDEATTAELKRAVEEGNERLITLLNDALICAKQRDFDLFNALDLMDSRTFLEKLKFGVGDGKLKYYIYNWRCTDMKAEQIAVVLQ